MSNIRYNKKKGRWVYKLIKNNMTYSFSKGLFKGFQSVLVIAISLVALGGLSDISIGSLITTYIMPVVGSLTVGGVLTIILNYIKIKSQ